MKFLAHVSPPSPIKTSESRQISLVYAFLLVVMVLAQLFAYEKFPDLIAAYELPGGIVTAHLVAALLVISSVFALPFLLRMSVSPLMRFVSMACGWIVPTIWIVLGNSLTVFHPTIANVGLLGARVTLLPGIWVLCVAIALLVMAAWASWGMWPQMPHRK